MSNNEKYYNIFKTVFAGCTVDFDENFTFERIEIWDSLTHMDLITKIEDEFGIMLRTEDILNFGSYENGKRILEKYGISF